MCIWLWKYIYMHVCVLISYRHDFVSYWSALIFVSYWRALLECSGSTKVQPLSVCWALQASQHIYSYLTSLPTAALTRLYSCCPCFHSCKIDFTKQLWILIFFFIAALQHIFSDPSILVLVVQWFLRKDKIKIVGRRAMNQFLLTKT